MKESKRDKMIEDKDLSKDEDISARKSTREDEGEYTPTVDKYKKIKEKIPAKGQARYVNIYIRWYN